MNCDWVQENICLYLYNELADDARHELEQHIRRCSDCAAELAAQQEFQAQMSALPVEEPSASFLAAARMRLQESLETARAESRVVSPLRLRSHGVAAAGALLARAGRGAADGGLRFRAVGTMYSAMRRQPATWYRRPVDRGFHRRHYLHRAQAEFRQGVRSHYERMTPESVEGTVSDAKIQEHAGLCRQEQLQQFRRASGFGGCC